MNHEIIRRSKGSSIVDPLVGHSTNSSCTPHSIDDILSRPRRVHVTSLLLPECRRTSGEAKRPHSWCDEVDRVVERNEDYDGIRWESMYWCPHSLAATTSTKPGDDP